MVAYMDITAKIKLLEERFQKLSSSEKENYGVCRKIKREIRKLQKEVAFRA
jgi:ribosomal protein L29